MLNTVLLILGLIMCGVLVARMTNPRRGNRD